MKLLGFFSPPNSGYSSDMKNITQIQGAQWAKKIFRTSEISYFYLLYTTLQKQDGPPIKKFVW